MEEIETVDPYEENLSDLREYYDELRFEYRDVVEEYNSLLDDYFELEENYKTLKYQYNNLEQENYILEDEISSYSPTIDSDSYELGIILLIFMFLFYGLPFLFNTIKNIKKNKALEYNEIRDYENKFLEELKRKNDEYDKEKNDTK